MGAVVRLLPLVARAHQPPAMGGSALGFGAVDAVLGAQFIGLEFAAEADVIGDPHRLIEAARPDGNDLFDHGPGADGVDPDLLVSMENGLGHGGAHSQTASADGVSMREVR